MSEELKACDGCGQTIPLKNLRRLKPLSRKLYCWQCAGELRSATVTGDPYLKPKKKSDAETH
jgi:hypothetical protein